MKTRILLVNMPFVSVRYPSPALSLLKAVLTAEGIACDVAYLNLLFQAFCGEPRLYEAIADFLIIGETIFGKELFGEDWIQSPRGGLAALDAPMLPSGPKRNSIRDALLRLRSKAGPFLELCLNHIDWKKYTIIGFTSVYSQQVASLALARHIRARHPDKMIAFGGANCEEEMGRALLRLFPFVDWVFNGEADRSFPRAIRQWESGELPEGIEGVSFRQNGKLVHQGTGQTPELDSLPYPDFEDYFSAIERWAPQYADVAPLSLELSRGCWWAQKSQCIFCGLNCRKPTYRRKSSQRALAEINDLTQRYQVDRVILTDSVLDMSFFKTLLPELARRAGLEELFLETRANLNRDQVRLLKAAGVKSLQPGIESLDTDILRLMKKGTSLLQNIQFLKWVRENRIFPTWNLLYGFPGEPSDAYYRMAALIPSIMHLSPPMEVTPVLLVRFSPLVENGQAWNLREIHAHAAYQSVYPFDQEDLDQLAYFFDAPYGEKPSASEYILPLKEQIRAWKHCWEQPEPPSLTVQHVSARRIAITDTRPSRFKNQVILEGGLALAYLACEAIQTLEGLSAEIRRLDGTGDCGDAVLREQLDDLVAKRLMLREGDRYLSLATAFGQDLEPSENW